MSGFLHQLAARSLGLAPQIKLRSALPYAAPALDSLPLAAINTEYPPTTERIVGMVPPLSIPDTTRHDALQPDEGLPEPLVAINANGLPMNGRAFPDMATPGQPGSSSRNTNHATITHAEPTPSQRPPQQTGNADRLNALSQSAHPSASQSGVATARSHRVRPEVHITIGRLEVNPPARPAPLPPPRPRGPAPLSLSDYLARRHGGRS
jgi:hypothetical protein